MEREKIFPRRFFEKCYPCSPILHPEFLSCLNCPYIFHTPCYVFVWCYTVGKYPGGENCRSLLSKNFQMSNEAKSCGKFVTTQNVVMSVLHHNLYVTLLGNTAGEKRGLNQSGTMTTTQDHDSRSLPRLFVLFSLLLCFSYSFPSCSSFCFRLGYKKKKETKYRFHLKV